MKEINKELHISFQKAKPYFNDMKKTLGLRSTAKIEELYETIHQKIITILANKHINMTLPLENIQNQINKLKSPNESIRDFTQAKEHLMNYVINEISLLGINTSSGKYLESFNKKTLNEFKRILGLDLDKDVDNNELYSEIYNQIVANLVKKHQKKIQRTKIEKYINNNFKGVFRSEEGKKIFIDYVCYQMRLAKVKVA